MRTLGDQTHGDREEMMEQGLGGGEVMGMEFQLGKGKGSAGGGQGRLHSTTNVLDAVELRSQK